MLQRLRRFWKEGMWQDHPEWGAWKRRGVRQLRLISLIISEVNKEKILLQAYALTYTALLALVPVLALVISAFQGFGGMGNMLQDRLRPWLMRNLVPETGKSVYAYLDSMVRNISFESLGVIGVIGVIYTALSALRTTEDAFNDIMHTERTRSILRRFAVYWSMLTLGPLLLVASLSIQTAVLQSTWIQQVLSISIINIIFWRLTAVLLTCCAFWMSYKFVPARQVNIWSALYGGLVAGVAWELLRLTYYTSLAGSFRWHAIYGTLAVLPITLVWLYLTWLIVLGGAVITYCHQHLDMLVEARDERPLSHRYRERLVCATMLIIARRYLHNETPAIGEEISSELEISPKLTHSLLCTLEDGGFVVRLAVDDDDADHQYQPARDLGALKLQDVVAYARESGNQEIPLPEVVAAVEKNLGPAEKAMRESLGSTTFRDLVFAPSKEQRRPQEPGVNRGHEKQPQPQAG